MKLVRFLGIAMAVSLTPIVAWGVWLLATPDYDGGRRFVGSLIVVCTVVIAFVYALAYTIVRKRIASIEKGREGGG